MKLYTINSTPVRSVASKAKNDEMCAKYPHEVAEALAAFGIEGFTMYEVMGYWKGQAERSFKIELATNQPEKIEAICVHLRDTYHQDSVMLTSDTVTFI